MSETESHTTDGTIESKKLSVLGLLSTIFGGLSMVPFLGVMSVPGLILGIIGLFKKGGTLAIIGTVLSIAGAATSPILWGTAACIIDSDSCKQTIEESKQKHQEMKVKKQSL